MSKIKIFTIAISILLSVSVIAQDRRVAVFDPVGSVPTFIRDIVREEISTVVVNTSGYVVLERALITQVLQEDQFQASGLVDDAQVSEIGRRLGANLAFVTNVTQMTGGNFHISARLIDVISARVERQQTTVTTRGDADLVQIVNQLANQMFGQVGAVTPQPQQPTPPVTQPQQAVTPAFVGGTLTASGRRVIQDGRRLSNDEVRQIMAGTNALHSFNQGRSQALWGNITFYSGTALFIVTAIPFIDELAWGWFATDFLIGAAIGAGLATYGLILLRNSRNSIGNSVNMFNQQGTTANVELNFGITQSGGIGLALNF